MIVSFFCFGWLIIYLFAETKIHNYRIAVDTKSTQTKQKGIKGSERQSKAIKNPPIYFGGSNFKNINLTCFGV